MNIAPLVLFVYNRPKHSLRTLEAIKKNYLSANTKLYIFADGPKENTTDKELFEIKETRKLLREQQWCGEVEIIESIKNVGLAKSIENGVSRIMELHGKAIILEDDIVTSPYFLTYMNEALHLFENRLDIGAINAYAIDFLSKNDFPEYFLIYNSDCWGWATWKDRWKDYIHDAKFLKDQLIKLNKLHLFEFGGHIPILDAQIEGRIDTWDVQWHAVNIIQNRKSVFSKHTFIQNIGQDGSGTHYTIVPENMDEHKVPLNMYDVSLANFILDNPLEFIPRIEKKFRKHYLKQFQIPIHKRGINLLKRLIKNLIKKTI